MTVLPDDVAIRARAEELSLLSPGAAMPSRMRAQVAQLILNEQSAPPAPVLPAGELLSRFTHETAGGTLRVDVVFFPSAPTPKGPPSDG